MYRAKDTVWVPATVTCKLPGGHIEVKVLDNHGGIGYYAFKNDYVKPLILDKELQAGDIAKTPNGDKWKILARVGDSVWVRQGKNTYIKLVKDLERCV